MRILKLTLLHALCLGWDVLVAPLWFVLWALWGQDLRAEGGLLSFEFKPESYPMGGPKSGDGYLAIRRGFLRGFYLVNRKAAVRGKERPRPWAGTTIGHFGFYSPGARAPEGHPLSGYQVHERHHVRQEEAAALGAAFWALVWSTVVWALGHEAAAIVVLVVHWVLAGPPTMAAGGWAGSWLRSDRRGVYAGSAHEIGARGVQFTWDQAGREP